MLQGQASDDRFQDHWSSDLNIGYIFASFQMVGSLPWFYGLIYRFPSMYQVVENEAFEMRKQMNMV